MLSFIMNLITGFLGIFLIPISGLGVEMLLSPVSFATFSLEHWILDFMVIIILNTLIEGIFLQSVLKIRFKKLFWWVCCANICSVMYCVFYMLVCNGNVAPFSMC